MGCPSGHSPACAGPSPPFRAETQVSSIFADDNQLGTKHCDLALSSLWRTSVKDVVRSFYFYFGDCHQYCVDIFGNLERKYMCINVDLSLFLFSESIVHLFLIDYSVR